MQFLNQSGHCAVVMLHCFKLMLPLPMPVSNYDITINFVITTLICSI